MVLGKLDHNMGKNNVKVLPFTGWIKDLYIKEKILYNQ